MIEDSGGKLDLDEYARRHRWKVEILPEEPPQEAEFRRLQKAADARLHRWRDGALLAVAVAFILALAGGCMALSFSTTASADDKKWAWSTLTLIAGAVVGYFFGRSRPPSQ